VLRWTAAGKLEAGQQSPRIIHCNELVKFAGATVHDRRDILQ
jgi:hypothetical protein